MEKKRLVILLIAAIAVSFSIRLDTQLSASPNGKSSEDKKQKKVLKKAIKDLEKNPDQLIRRNAGRQIARLANVNGINKAIKPLFIGVSNADGSEGIVNRSIYIGALGVIARYNTGVGAEDDDELDDDELEELDGDDDGDNSHKFKPGINDIVDFLAFHLLEDPSDLIRISAARALGLTKNPLAIQPLEIAIATDPVPFVLLQAETSLNRLKRELGIVVPVAALSSGPLKAFGNPVTLGV